MQVSAASDAAESTTIFFIMLLPNIDSTVLIS